MPSTVSRENLRLTPPPYRHAFGMFLIISVVRLSFPLRTSSIFSSLIGSGAPGDPPRLRTDRLGREGLARGSLYGAGGFSVGDAARQSK